MKIKFCILFTIVILISSCKSQVLVKFTNVSNEDYKKLKVGVLSKQFEFFNLKSGQSTEFVKVDSTYSYCYAKVFTEKDTIGQLPFDYAGEKLYKSGKLNIKINIVEGEKKKRDLDINGER
jgi:hypothetical protein